jgi:predicted nucleic acid-binding protein
LSLLADTTAMIAARRRGTATRARIDELAEGEIWICDVVRLEMLRGADNPSHMRAMRAALDQLRSAPIDANIWRRAEEVYEGLARFRGGRYRGVQPTDVVIAATAEAHGLAVLHDDAHFDLIAQVTDQPMVRLPS